MSEFNMWVQQSGKHNKFWTCEVIGKNFNTTYGRIGTDGQTSSKSFSSNYEAQAWADKKILEKHRKGYTKVGKDEHALLQVQAQIIGAGNKVEHVGLAVLHAGYLVEIEPEGAYDPNLDIYLMIQFRLRDKSGATDPYLIALNEKEAFQLHRPVPIAPSVSIERMAWGKYAIIEWNYKSEPITNSHELYPVIEKAHEIVGHTLFGGDQ